MSGVRLIRAAELTATPWKNGGGETREIAVSPDGAGIDDFDWRVSMATVASDGPFSVFAGIDRTLTVLDGAGLRLAVTGLPVREVRPGDAPWSFPADAPTHATRLGGPVTDLNVMTRRDRAVHRVRVVDADTEMAMQVDGHPVLVFCLDGLLTIAAGEEHATLQRHDSAVLDDPPASLRLRGACLVIEIVPR